uniref:trichohyalin-like n=1 Tax=Scatophagus argus TaxID=75038 RepID=UPI001ED7DBA2|nr:trichohyalin-like [Scatophagus argus]
MLPFCSGQTEASQNSRLIPLAALGEFNEYNKQNTERMSSSMFGKTFFKSPRTSGEKRRGLRPSSPEGFDPPAICKQPRRRGDTTSFCENTSTYTRNFTSIDEIDAPESAQSSEEEQRGLKTSSPEDFDSPTIWKEPRRRGERPSFCGDTDSSRNRDKRGRKLQRPGSRGSSHPSKILTETRRMSEGPSFCEDTRPSTSRKDHRQKEMAEENGEKGRTVYERERNTGPRGEREAGEGERKARVVGKTVEGVGVDGEKNMGEGAEEKREERQEKEEKEELKRQKKEREKRQKKEEKEMLKREKKERERQEKEEKEELKRQKKEREKQEKEEKKREQREMKERKKQEKEEEKKEKKERKRQEKEEEKRQKKERKKEKKQEKEERKTKKMKETQESDGVSEETEVHVLDKQEGERQEQEEKEQKKKEGMERRNQEEKEQKETNKKEKQERERERKETDREIQERETEDEKEDRTSQDKEETDRTETSSKGGLYYRLLRRFLNWQKKNVIKAINRSYEAEWFITLDISGDTVQQKELKIRREYYRRRHLYSLQGFIEHDKERLEERRRWKAARKAKRKCLEEGHQTSGTGGRSSTRKSQKRTCNILRSHNRIHTGTNLEFQVTKIK